MRHLSVRCIFLVLLAVAPQLAAANRFFIPNQRVPKGGQDIPIFLRADIDQSLYGFSFGIHYNQNALTITDVTLDGTVIPTSAPDFFDGIIDDTRGLIGYGCVLDFGPTFADAIASGANQAIAHLVVNVKGNAGTSSSMSLETVPTNPDPARPVKNVMTNDKGVSILPTLAAGTITIEDRTPQITQLTGNSGASGTVFQVTGLFLGEPGLAVKVGGVDAVATLQGNGTTLDVTAPECAAPGFKALEVCTIYGCDSDPNGFECPGVAGGRQKPGDENQDGKLDLSDPVSILNHLFLGTNPSLPCGDGTVSDPANKALLDSNHDGKVDLSDSVHMLSFLFIGGPPPFACGGVPACACITIEGCPDNAKCP